MEELFCSSRSYNIHLVGSRALFKNKEFEGQVVHYLAQRAKDQEKKKTNQLFKAIDCDKYINSAVLSSINRPSTSHTSRQSTLEARRPQTARSTIERIYNGDVDVSGVVNQTLSSKPQGLKLGPCYSKNFKGQHTQTDRQNNGYVKKSGQNSLQRQNNLKDPRSGSTTQSLEQYRQSVALLDKKEAWAPQNSIEQSNYPPMQPNESMITSNDFFYGRRDDGKFQQAAETVRSLPAQQNNFACQWAFSKEDLKGEDQKDQFKTTNQSFNDRVHPHDTSKEVQREQVFYDWAKKSRLYYGKLLSEEAANKVDDVFEKSNALQKKDIIEAGRMLYATCQPDKHKSMSHYYHDKKYSMSNQQQDLLEKQEIKYKANGRPTSKKYLAKPKPERQTIVRSIPQHQHQNQQEVNAPKPKLAQPSTQKSQIPLRWGASNQQPNSTYRETHYNPQRHSNKQPQATKPPVTVTAPCGAVNNLLNQCHFDRFIVPNSFFQRPPVRGTDQSMPNETTAQQAFQRLPAETMQRQLKNQYMITENAKKERVKSSLPLGEKGICVNRKWNSTYQVEHNENINNASNLRTGYKQLVSERENFKSALNGPTGPYGVMSVK